MLHSHYFELTLFRTSSSIIGMNQSEHGGFNEQSGICIFRRTTNWFYRFHQYNPTYDLPEYLQESKAGLYVDEATYWDSINCIDWFSTQIVGYIYVFNLILF